MNMDILDKPLLKSLLNETIPFSDVMNAYNIKTSVATDLSSTVLGFTYVSRRGHYHLVLNGNLNYETQLKTFVHEIKHIVEDLPTVGYMIGLDKQYTSFEKSADKVSEGIINYL